MALQAELAATAAALRRVRASRARLLLARTRDDRRAWVTARRERTRRLIELGGLVVKAGLVELADDDRAVLLGILVEAAAKLRGDEREQLRTLWRRRGQRAFAEAADDAG